MPPTDTLPTYKSAAWTITAFRDSLISELASNTGCVELSLYLYALSPLGWSEIRKHVLAWKARDKARSVIAYVGTDHGLTDPDALQTLADDGVNVWMPTDYTGVFHPKVVWLNGDKVNVFWIGSNNLTREGLLNNVECASVIRSAEVPTEMTHWRERIASISESMTAELLASYRAERTAFNAARVAAGTFVWSRRSTKPPAPPHPAPSSKVSTTPTPAATTTATSTGVSVGDLILEIMPLETGSEGKQVQFPMAAVVAFFGIGSRVGASKTISLSYIGNIYPRSLTVTIFGNRTARLSLNELDYRDRPCLVRFHRTAANTYEYEIIQQSIFPSRYKALLAICGARTRSGSRRWGMVTK